MKNGTSLTLLVSLLFLFSGCSQPAKVSQADQSFVWQTKQTRAFDSYDYNTTKKAEAMADLTDKLKLRLLPSFEQATEAIQKELAVEGVIQEPEEFVIRSEAKEVHFSSLIKFRNKQGDYLSYGTVTTSYHYLEDLETVKLSTQRITIYNATGDGQYHGHSLLGILDRLGHLLKVDTLENKLEKFIQETRNPETLKGRDLVIYEDFKEKKQAKGIGKSFGVQYNEQGVLEKIYAYTINYTV